MLGVATKLDVPVKIAFMRTQEDGTDKPGMLGLGDIVLPGLMIALAFKFDVISALKKTKGSIDTFWET